MENLFFWLFGMVMWLGLFYIHFTTEDKKTKNTVGWIIFILTIIGVIISVIIENND